ncbi:E3 ubiquitin-protein ligase rnf168 [Mobula hypostoma]|uniref:E3 ubiquitin-protein ligase rnf168 n=1 Tax=Mobula hypostoma TaxID=723540 RepID=UPI002FC288CC
MEARSVTMRHNKQGCSAETEARGPPPVLSLAECICPVCQELLDEPVTPPCGHSFCRSCFQQTVEISNLNCPMCRRRLSNWVRAQVRRGGLVNTELEQRIRQQFPRGHVQEPAEVNRLGPPPQLCKPGELRQEYEEQISKLKEERRAREEEEHRASEDFIQKLLAEEQEQQMYLTQKKKEMEDQLRRDEQLAKLLSEEVNLMYGTASKTMGGYTKSVSSKFNSSISKGIKLTAHNPSNTESIQRYLSPTVPKYQTAEISTLGSNLTSAESTSEGDELITSSSSTKIRLFHCDKDGEPDSSSHQSELVQVIEGAPNEEITDLQMEYISQHSPECRESVMPQTCSSAQDGSEKSMESVPLELKMNSINCNDDQLDSTFMPVLNHRLEHACTSADCCSSVNMDHIAVQNLIQNQAAEDEILSQTPSKMSAVLKRKVCNSSDVSTLTCVMVKKRKICPDVHDKPSANTELLHDAFNHEQLADWEKQLFEKHKMEEQDRLLALKIQKELDKEMQAINRTRGTPDAYLLRAKKLPACEKNMLAKNKTPLATAKGHQTSRSSVRSQSRNKQAMLKNISSEPQRQKSRILQDPTQSCNKQRAKGHRPLASMDANSAALMSPSEPRNGKKQQTIDDMFQKCNTK